MRNQILLLVFFFLIPFYGFSQSSAEQSLDQLIQKKIKYNSNTKRGFCIQVYNGNEKQAIQHIVQFSALFPNIQIKRIYNVPEWKVQTQIYKTRLEADRVLNQIKLEYSGARVVYLNATGHF
ncbi:SPOR domain-containing protein [Flavicella sp.]|uniref:SPOR domain-containing protein n=1 Tax=Flavicella sp. TaxID=2957742 RepID=UPI00301ACDBC